MEQRYHLPPLPTNRGFPRGNILDSCGNRRGRPTKTKRIPPPCFSNDLLCAGYGTRYLHLPSSLPPQCWWSLWLMVPRGSQSFQLTLRLCGPTFLSWLVGLSDACPCTAIVCSGATVHSWYFNNVPKAELWQTSTSSRGKDEFEQNKRRRKTQGSMQQWGVHRWTSSRNLCFNSLMSGFCLQSSVIIGGSRGVFLNSQWLRN